MRAERCSGDKDAQYFLRPRTWFSDIQVVYRTLGANPSKKMQVVVRGKRFCFTDVLDDGITRLVYFQ